MMQRCAVYARYSSDQQSPLSIEDQIRKCREHAQQRGWSVLEEHIYRDAELSGAGADRPGLQRLQMATQKIPRLFDVLLIDDTSRLSRRSANQSNIVDKLCFTGFRLIAVSQGIDTAHEQADVLMAVHGLVDSLYIKELGKKTHRGLEGRALKGLHTGGRCFGYRNEQTPEGVRLRIESGEASIVKRIFELSASGASLKAIAKRLNGEGIPPPRPRRGKIRPSWCHTAIRAMLRNELYVGTVVWNRSRFVKRPGTNKRVARPRLRSEWRIIDRPELRIITAELWRSVQERQELIKTVYGRAGAGVNKASSSRYLLTGFLKCGLCNANLVIVAGKGRKTIRKYYGCPRHRDRGACSNGVTIRQDVVEKNFFRGLQETVLTDQAVDYTIGEFTRRVRDHQVQVSAGAASSRLRKEAIEQELARLIAAIAHTGHSQLMIEAITARERELDDLSQSLQAAGRRVAAERPERIREFVMSKLTDVIGLLNTDTDRARAELAKHTTEIRMSPEADADGKLHYVAEGDWNFFGGSDFGMVAGDGFEPPTFGL